MSLKVGIGLLFTKLSYLLMLGEGRGCDWVFKGSSVMGGGLILRHGVDGLEGRISACSL